MLVSAESLMSFFNTTWAREQYRVKTYFISNFLSFQQKTPLLSFPPYPWNLKITFLIYYTVLCTYILWKVRKKGEESTGNTIQKSLKNILQMAMVEKNLTLADKSSEKW